MLAAAYDQVVLRIVAIAVFATSVVLAAPASSAETAQYFFRTPSKNIYCAWLSGPQTLRCDILSGVRPLPPKPASCDFDWGAGYEVKRTGRARILCVSDSVVTNSAKVLPGRRGVGAVLPAYRELRACAARTQPATASS
jgi:hypothetical protein